MGTTLGQIFCTFHKDGFILGRNFLYISVKWVHFSGKNVCTLGHKSVPEPSITSKIHREPPPPPVLLSKMLLHKGRFVGKKHMKSLQSLCMGQQGEKVIRERRRRGGIYSRELQKRPQHQHDNQAKVLSTVEGRRIIDIC